MRALGRIRFLIATAVVVVALVASGSPAAAAPVPVSTLKYSPGSGTSIGLVAVLWSNGSATTFVNLTEQADRLEFSVVAELCEGPPRIEVAVDDKTLFGRHIAGFGKYAIPGSWAPGRHKVTFRYTNDRITPACDRNLKIRNVAFVDSGVDNFVLVNQFSNLQAVTVSPTTSGVTRPFPRLWTRGTITADQDSQGAVQLRLGLTPVPCNGMPNIRVAVDGVTVFQGPAPEPEFMIGSQLDLLRSFPNGMHRVQLTMLDDLRTASCDRAVGLNSVQFFGAV